MRRPCSIAGIWRLAAIAAALAGGPAMAATPVLVATNLDGVFAFAPPPPGFDALHATQAELAAYGFPPRPSVANAHAYENWLRAVRAAGTRLVPRLQQTDLAAGAALRFAANGTRNGPQASYNWSAEVLANGATSFGNGSFSAVAAWFNVPVAQQAFGVCTGNWDRLSSWVGLDGWYSNEVFQAGTESDAYCANGSTATTYYAWFEWYPALALRITNLAVSPGDTMLVWMLSTGNTSGNAIIVNETTNQSVVIHFTAPAGTVLVGNSAEMVQERPSVNNVLSMLTNYSTAWMSSFGTVLLNNSTLYNFGWPPPGAVWFPVTMVDNNGVAISAPDTLGPNAASFAAEGNAR